VKKLVDDEKLQRTMANAARASVAAKSWESNNAKLIEFYQQAIMQATKTAAGI